MAAFHARDRTPDRQAMRDARTKYLKARREAQLSSSRTERRHSTEGGVEADRRAPRARHVRSRRPRTVRDASSPA
eukprot:7359409-Prymnesium_polylepis.1